MVLQNSFAEWFCCTDSTTTWSWCGSYPPYKSSRGWFDAYFGSL